MTAKLLPGLPPYAPPAEAFPRKWGPVGLEGIVVGFQTNFDSWTGNFRPGAEGLTLAAAHPNKVDALVLARGDLWVVDESSRSAELLLPSVLSMLPVENPDGWILNRQGLAFARLGPHGLTWQTRRLSWDGFADLKVSGSELAGIAWSAVEDQWYPFSVDLRSGRSNGGSFGDSDVEGWERICE